MRAWSNQEPETQRDSLSYPSNSAVNRNFVPRHNFVPREARPRTLVLAEGLPPRPPTPTEFALQVTNSRNARHRVQAGGRGQSPHRDRSFATDADMADATADVRPCRARLS